MKLLILVLGVVIIATAFDLEREEMRTKDKIVLEGSADE